MEEITLTETESRYFADLFLCCDVEKSGKIPMLKATELYRTANLSNDVIREITSLSGIPQSALHISRSQFYSCLKLIAAYQASMPLRQELISASVNLPLPRFSWKESPPSSTRVIPADAMKGTSISTSMNLIHQTNGVNSGERTDSLSRRHATGWHETRSPDLIQLATGTVDPSISSVKAGSGSRRNSSNAPHLHQSQIDAAGNSDVPSTDSEVEQNESNGADGGVGGGGGGGSGSGAVGGDGSGIGISVREQPRHRGCGDGVGGGSPEAWSTNSDSPTPTNSVAERPWAKDNLWHGLLGDEHRQLLGTEEESSDRHSSDDENDTDLEVVYQITPEQREYYFKQFKAVQHDPNGLLSGHVARVFFEKSRIPVEELRHIWQLCDVTRDGALSLAEFTAAMHLVVLRRNNIPLPAILPACLHPNVLKHSTLASTGLHQQHPAEPPEADLLHLNDDDDDDNTDNTIISTTANIKRSGGGNTGLVANVASNEKNVMNLSTLSTSSQASTNSKQGLSGVGHLSLSPPPPPPVKNRSISNSPRVEPNLSPPVLYNRNIWDVPPTQWTKFVESPTSNVSSPGPKPVNFDMQRTAQAVVSDPQILHPVPLRVTPVGPSDITPHDDSRKLESISYDADVVESNAKQQGISHAIPQTSLPISVAAGGGGGCAAAAVAVVGPNTSATTSAAIVSSSSSTNHHRDSLQNNNDLRAIQRPQAKKLLPAKNVGALPPPPQREPSIGGGSIVTNCPESDTIMGGAPPSLPSLPSQATVNNILGSTAANKKNDPPPLPPPRPHRHGRSSSLDLNKFKITTPGNGQQPEIIAQASFDLQTTGFADFAHFPDGGETPRNELDSETSNQINNSTGPPSRFSLQSNQRVSAFEVYRKPNTPKNSQSPEPPTPVTAAAGTATATAIAVIVPQTINPSNATSLSASSLAHAEMYEKRVIAISETLKHVSFKKDNNMADILRHLREQNTLLLRLCNDLSDELLSVIQRKEEMRLKLDASGIVNGPPPQPIQPPLTAPRTSSSISAPVTANTTGGSGSSGVHSNV